MFEQADGSEINDVVTVPARPHLRDVNPECTQLSGEKQDSFYSIVTTLL